MLWSICLFCWVVFCAVWMKIVPKCSRWLRVFVPPPSAAPFAIRCCCLFVLLFIVVTILIFKVKRFLLNQLWLIWFVSVLVFFWRTLCIFHIWGFVCRNGLDSELSAVWLFFFSFFWVIHFTLFFSFSFSWSVWWYVSFAEFTYSFEYFCLFEEWYYFCNIVLLFIFGEYGVYIQVVFSVDVTSY